MSKEETIYQINIYRRDSDTPIVLYDKTNLNEEEIGNHLKNVFASPNISILTTSSETLIFKSSQIDAIGVINNIDIKKRNKLKIKDSIIEKNINITDMVDLEEKSENNTDEIEVEKIEIGTIDDNSNENDNIEIGENLDESMDN